MQKDNKNTDNIWLLLLVLLLTSLQTIQETAKDFYEILKNTNLMDILPEEVASTMLWIALILAPIVIYQEAQKLRNDSEMGIKQKVISVIKILLTLCAGLITSSTLFGFVTLPVAFTTAVPVIGLIFAALIILDQIKEEFYKKSTTKDKKAGYIILGLIVTALATLTVIGTLSTSTALAILISAFIFNTARKFLGVGGRVKNLRQAKKTQEQVETVPAAPVQAAQEQVATVPAAPVQAAQEQVAPAEKEQATTGPAKQDGNTHPEALPALKSADLARVTKDLNGGIHQADLTDANDNDSFSSTPSTTI